MTGSVLNAFQKVSQIDSQLDDLVDDSLLDKEFSFGKKNDDTSYKSWDPFT